MTRERRRPITAAEFVAQLEADPEYQRKKAAFEAEMRARVEADRQAEAALVADLRTAGFSVDSVWDLVNTRDRYTAALPILLDHLQQPYPPTVRQGIARALAVRESKFAWARLISLFRAEFDKRGNGVKWAIGCALAAAADEEVMPDLIALLRERRHGVNRVILVEPLSRSCLANARAALEAAREDPELSREISRVLDRPKHKRRKSSSRSGS